MFGHRRRSVALLLALMLLALPLAACGKRAAPEPPTDEPNTFPRIYPSE